MTQPWKCTSMMVIIPLLCLTASNAFTAPSTVSLSGPNYRIQSSLHSLGNSGVDLPLFSRHYKNDLRSNIIKPTSRRYNRLIPCLMTTRTSASLRSSSSSQKAAASSLIEVLRENKLVGKIIGSISALSAVLLRELRELSRIQTTMFVATLFIGFFLGRMNPFWKRFTSVVDVPSSLFGVKARTLRGRAVAVSDGDTIRFFHVPTWFHKSKLKKKQKFSEHAMPIRICTIDTPETAKFGKPGQPFGEDAKGKLKEMVDGKFVSVRLLQQDQYGRGVAEVYSGRWPFRKSMDEEMLKAGLAEVYMGGGAVYGPKGKEAYLEMQQEAKREKLGIWSQKNRESAADFKKRTK